MPSCLNRSAVDGIVKLDRLFVDGVAPTAAKTVPLLSITTRQQPTERTLRAPYTVRVYTILLSVSTGYENM